MKRRYTLALALLAACDQGRVGGSSGDGGADASLSPADVGPSADALPSGDAEGADLGADAGAFADATPAADGNASADAEVPCPTDQHRCGGTCVSDLLVDSCGDRCVPCPAVANATTTCNGTCGFSCRSGFFACLGQCLPDAEAPCGVRLTANAWTKLTDATQPGGDNGPRNMGALAYEPTTGEYILVGGTLSYGQTPRPYDVQALTLADPRWKNHYPLDKVGQWGPEIGDAAAPFYSNETWGEMDPQGVARPNWQLYPGAKLYNQFSFDPASHTLLMFMWNHTFAYDVLRRAYSFYDPSPAPAGGPQNPRLLWGSMAFDPAGQKVLLFGGGNALEPDGQPGTWIFEIATHTWRRLSGPQPGPRALSPLVADPDQRKALLFGGDELDRLLNDTWAFDFASETWSQLAPTTSAGPRAGHHLLFLPTSRRVVMFGGYDYSSTTDYVASHYAARPMELWRFDWSGPAWELVKRWDASAVTPDIGTSSNLTYPAAAGAGDVVVAQFKNGYSGQRGGSETWAIRVDPSTVDPAGTAQYGAPGGSQVTRSGAYDPAWYETGWPTPDPAAFAATLAAIPSNTWTEVMVPNRPAHNHDWGTAAIDPVRQVILRFSGGHSAHSGTDVLEYDLVNNRYHLSYPSEIPLDFEYTNDQTPGQWSFDNNPWMTGHTYRTYAYSTAVGKMVLVKAPYTYLYDLDRHDWELMPVSSNFGGDFYTNTTIATPAGMLLINNNGLFSLAAGAWSRAAVSGTLPEVHVDGTIGLWDTTRDRLLLFSQTDSGMNTRGQVWSYAGGAITALSPTGAAAMETSSDGFHREGAYVPSEDKVVLATHYDLAGSPRTPVYDCAANRWYAYDFGPLQATIYGNSLGVVIDASGRIWAVDTSSRVYLLKLDSATASRTPL
ncbi:MAG: kelch repeat-containing protein [Myxococcota bacterium]